MRRASRLPLGLCCVGLCLLALAAGGCGRRTGSVSGKVTYKNKPLPGGYVNFFSEGDDQAAKTSPISADGSYSVSGIPVGKAKITVQGVYSRGLPGGKGKLPGGFENPKSEEKTVYVPPQYSTAEQSGLTYDVQAGSQEHNIDLK